MDLAKESSVISATGRVEVCREPGIFGILGDWQTDLTGHSMMFD